MEVNKILLAVFLLQFIISIKAEVEEWSCYTDIDFDQFMHPSQIRVYYFDSSRSDPLIIKCDNLKSSDNVALSKYIQSLGIFQLHRVIESLTIENSFLPVINSLFFEGVFNFKIITITSSNLSIISTDFLNNMTNLERLNLSHNDIETIQPNTFENCTKLTHLDLSFNKLTSLEGILKISSLENLYMECNKIASVEGISRLSNLREFNISHNHELEVTDEIHKLPLLEKFDISWTNITEFKNCSNFRKLLYVSDNILTSICKNFSKTIEDIDYAFNMISDINDDTFSGLTRLKVLMLDFNLIKELTYDMFKDLKVLKVLKLQSNNIASISKGCFRNLNRLEELILHTNHLTSLEHGVFSGLVSLSYLDISKNKIKHFDATIIYPLSSLNVLYLEGNMLDEIDTDTFLKHLKYLDTVRLSFSNIGCEALLGIISAFKSKGVTIKEGYTKHNDNVNGISCNPDIKNATQTLEEIRLNNALLVMSRIYVIAIVICVMFVLIAVFTIIVKLFYLSRNYKRLSIINN